MVPSLVVEHTIFLAEVDTGDLMYFALQTIEVGSFVGGAACIKLNIAVNKTSKIIGVE
jgi:hypothetical protein